MKTTTFLRSSARVGLLAAALSLSNWASAQFTAFNDHVPGTIGTQTSSNASTWGIPPFSTPSAGPLKDIASGNPVGVNVIITTNGTGTTLTGGNTAGVPAAGTPCYNLFNGIVYFGGSAAPPSSIQIHPNAFVTYTFTNLTPGATYNFRGSHVRGGSGSNYSNRWTRVELIGATTATPAHSANVATSLQEPTALTLFQVAAPFGENQGANQGDVVGWDNIVPGGSAFQIQCTQYYGPLPPPNTVTNATTPPYGYAISGFQLIEANVVPSCAAITQGPTNQTVAQCGNVTMRVTATGNPAPSYQWFKGATSIPNATNPTYSITNAQPSDSGTYHVMVSNTAPGCTATNATNTLTVTPAPAMAVVSATGSATNLSHIVVAYSAPIDPNSVDPNGFAFHLTGGLNPASVTVENTTNILLVTDAPRAAGVNYCMTIDASSAASVCGASPAAAKTVQIGAWYVYALGITDSGWTFNDSGIAPPANWTQRSFDDTVAPWQTGTGVFDIKNSGPRLGTFGDFVINTALVLTNYSGPFGTNDIPTYNFRKHFTFPLISGARLLMNGAIDDAAIIYINGQEAARVGGLTNGVAIPFEEYGGANTNGHGYGSRTVPTASNWTDTSVSLPLTNVVLGGDNVLAVELKQERNTSSDATMGLELLVVSGTPRLTITRSGTNDVIDWCTGTLQASTNPAAFFSDVANAVSPLTVTNTGPRKFYRLR